MYFSPHPLHTLSDHSPDKLNASVHAESSGIPVVVSSAGEAELSSAFGNAKIAHDERTILRNLGYPQPPTPIYCDNECTIGLAHDAIKRKQSKSMDLRWDWLRDRVLPPQPSRLLHQSPSRSPSSRTCSPLRHIPHVYSPLILLLYTILQLFFRLPPSFSPPAHFFSPFDDPTCSLRSQHPTHRQRHQLIFSSFPALIHISVLERVC